MNVDQVVHCEKLLVRLHSSPLHKRLRELQPDKANVLYRMWWVSVRGNFLKKKLDNRRSRSMVECDAKKK